MQLHDYCLSWWWILIYEAYEICVLHLENMVLKHFQHVRIHVVTFFVCIFILFLRCFFSIVTS